MEDCRTGIFDLVHPVTKTHQLLFCADLFFKVRSGLLWFTNLLKHLHDFLEFLECQIPVRVSATDQCKERLLIPLLRCHFGNNLLGQHVERLLGHSEAVELAAPDRIQQSRAFGQIIPRQWEQPPLGRAAHGVARSAHPL